MCVHIVWISRERIHGIAQVRSRLEQQEQKQTCKGPHSLYDTAVWQADVEQRATRSTRRCASTRMRDERCSSVPKEFDSMDGGGVGRGHTHHL